MAKSNEDRWAHDEAVKKEQHKCDLIWIVESTALALLNDRVLNFEARDNWENDKLINMSTLRKAMHMANTHTEYIQLASDDRAVVYHSLRGECHEYFCDAYPDTQLSNGDVNYYHHNIIHEPKTATQTGRESSRKEIMNTYSPVVIPREALVFGHALSKLTKDELMEVIRTAQKQSASFDGLPDSNFVSKQIADIEAGIQLCLKQLDK